MLSLPPGLALALSAFWLLWTLVVLANAALAFRPPRKGMLFLFGFFSSWLTVELAGHIIGALVLSALIAALLGLATTPIGLAALFVSALCVGLLALHLHAAQSARDVMRDLLKDRLPQQAARPIPASKLLTPFSPSRREVHVDRDITFRRVAGRKLKLDVFQPTAPSKNGDLRPAIIQIHGGAWIIGDKSEQALPLLNHLAANGWVGFNVNYRLSPAATWPEHLVDVKAAIAWVRENAEQYRIDPNFICVTGGSAGGHIAAVVALTQNDPRYQPGFEDADTSVHGAVPIYGVYDFTDRERLMGKFWRYRALEPLIMKKFLDDDPQAFRDASPIDLVRPDAPPMLIIHGTNDVLAPLKYARVFADRLREVSTSDVLYAEIIGAQHAFDVFGSPRCFHAVRGVERYLTRLWEDHRAADNTPPTGETP